MDKYYLAAGSFVILLLPYGEYELTRLFGCLVVRLFGLFGIVGMGLALTLTVLLTLPLPLPPLRLPCATTMALRAQ